MKSVKISVKNETNNRMCQFGDGGNGGGRSGVAKTQLAQGGSGGSSHFKGNACDIFRREDT